MIKIENIKVYNLEGAIRGMRNPMNSWDKSDSKFGIDTAANAFSILRDLLDSLYNIQELSLEKYNAIYKAYEKNGIKDSTTNFDIVEYNFIGKNDLALMQKLIAAGPEHRKFMRQIFVSMDITFPLLIWKEVDTYKINTVSNSCSTMHKLTSTPITRELFSFSNELDNLDVFQDTTFKDEIDSICDACESLRKKYLETKDKRYWRALVEILPESWNQKRTWSGNYEVLRNIISQRRNHKLQEWNDFINIIKGLPYAEDLIFYGVD